MKPSRRQRPLCRLPDGFLQDLAEFFKVFGDGTRLKILYVLLSAEMCVYDIAAVLGMSQSAISHQLRVLKKHTSRRPG